MKYILLLLIGWSITLNSVAQDDTVRIGKMVIIKSNIDKLPDSNKVYKGDNLKIGSPIQISFERNKKNKQLSNVSTSYFEWDLGFANYQNESPIRVYTSYTPNIAASIPTANQLKLNNLKSSNVNVWFVKQHVNIYKHYVNLNYAVGLEMFNLRFEQPISFRNDLPAKIKMDDISFSKNKLFVKYLTVPVQLNFNANPSSKHGLNGSIGMSAGYLLKARNKQISEERGKQKYNGTFNLNNWRLATIGEIGIGTFHLYGSYSRTNLFDKNLSDYKFYPYTLGIRFSKF